MDIQYVPDEEFVSFVKLNDCEARSIDGHMRWIMRANEGTEYIVRPESTRNDKQQWTI